MFEILVIDDDKNTRRLMNAILLGAGYTPVLAEDGERHLKYIIHIMWIWL